MARQHSSKVATLRSDWKFSCTIRKHSADAQVGSQHTARRETIRFNVFVEAENEGLSSSLINLQSLAGFGFMHFSLSKKNLNFIEPEAERRLEKNLFAEMTEHRILTRMK